MSLLGIDEIMIRDSRLFTRREADLFSFHFVYSQPVKTTPIYNAEPTYMLEEMLSDCPPDDALGLFAEWEEPIEVLLDTETNSTPLAAAMREILEMPTYRASLSIVDKAMAVAKEASRLADLAHQEYEDAKKESRVDAAWSKYKEALKKSGEAWDEVDKLTASWSIKDTPASTLNTTPFDKSPLDTSDDSDECDAIPEFIFDSPDDFGGFDEPELDALGIEEESTVKDIMIEHLSDDSDDSDDSDEKPQVVDDYKGMAYILAYRDKGSVEKVVKTAIGSDKSSVRLLMDEAIGFLERNCGYVGLQAAWINNASTRSLYNNTRIITGLNRKTDEREVLYVSQRTRRGDDMPDFEALTAFDDIDYAIKGLIINGALDCSDEALVVKGEKIGDVPMIVLAWLDNPQRTVDNFNEEKEVISLLERANSYKSSPYNRATPEFVTDDSNRYISRFTSNDPHHTSTSVKKTYDSFDYSSSSHALRYKTAMKEDETISDDGGKFTHPKLAKPLFDKNWLYGSDALNNSYYTHWKKVTADGGNLSNSLVLSMEFLGAFYQLSNRSFNLEIREVRGVEGAYQIAAYHDKDFYNTDFVPAPTVSISMSADRQSFRYKDMDSTFDIGMLLQEGWTNQTGSDKWDHERKYHIVTKGSLVEISAHWLWLMLADQMLTANLRYAAYFKTKGSFESHYIDNGTVYVDSHNKEVFTLSNAEQLAQASNRIQIGLKGYTSGVAPVLAMGLPVKGVKFKVGRPLFELYAKDIDSVKDQYFSLFLSKDDEGFYSKDVGISYTLLETDHKGNIKSVYSFIDIGGAIKKMVNVMDNNRYVQEKGMDIFDVTRSVVATARVFGCDIGIGFDFVSVQEEWSDSKSGLVMANNKPASTMEAFFLGI